MKIISDEFIEQHIDYAELVEALKMGFRNTSIQCPPKSTYDYKSDIGDLGNTFLFMPSWDNQEYFGAKLITTTPHNSNIDDPNKPYVNGVYNLFDAQTGVPLAVMSAKLLTHIRTAAISVLASSYLAKDKASSVLIIGNGNISPHYINAYASQESINRIYLWGRNFQKSNTIINKLEKNAITTAVEDFKTISKEVDIISCITSSKDPIVFQEHVSTGQHLDLAGSFTKEMQEVSTDVVASCSVYTDNVDVTPDHAGEIVNAIRENKFKVSDIKGDLDFLCQDDLSKRQSTDENTLFKSTGMAIEDLIMAIIIYKKFEEK